MTDKISYLNTDLDLVSPVDLTPLAAVLEASNMYTLHVTQVETGGSWARFEVDEDHDEPESHIGTMLTVIESLDAASREIWSGCTEREFNIGYECGSTPRQLCHHLSGELLARIATAGASVGISIYARDSDSKSTPCP